MYGVIVSSITGWSIPGIMGWIKTAMHLKRLRQYEKRMDNLDVSRLDNNDINHLDKIKNDISDVYAKGRMNELHYNLLVKMISSLEINQNKT